MNRARDQTIGVIFGKCNVIGCGNVWGGAPTGFKMGTAHKSAEDWDAVKEALHEQSTRQALSDVNNIILTASGTTLKKLSTGTLTAIHSKILEKMRPLISGIRRFLGGSRIHMCNEKTQAAMKTSQYAEVAQSVEQ